MAMRFNDSGRCGRLAACFAIAFIVLGVGRADAIRIKDVTHIHGLRENHLMGYGLVVGLNSTGDGSSTDFTAQSLANYLKRNNIQVNPDDIKIRNVAAVIVTASLPPFARRGGRIDVTVSSVGDATSLQGGTLLMTALYSAIPGKVYAVAQGAVSIGGFEASSGGSGVSKNHATAGKIPGGALVEIDSPVRFENLDEIRFILDQPDFTTAQRIAEVINFNLTDASSAPVSPAEVIVDVPPEFRGRLAEFVARIERLPVHPDQRARIVIDERTGTVVMGEGVRISSLALAHGSLTIQITKVNQVSQPEAFAGGDTTPFENTGIGVQEGDMELRMIDESVSLGEVVRSLNAIGVTPRDLIAILQSIKTLGALQAELVIR